MVRRGQGQPVERPELLQARDEADSALEARVAKGLELRDRSIRTEEELNEAKHDYARWSDYNAEMLRRMFSTGEIAEEYAVDLSEGWYPGKPLDEFVAGLRGDVDFRLTRLASVRDRLELIPLAKAISPPGRPSAPSAAGQSRRVFVVHGHDEASREKVARFLERLDLKPVVLHEQPNGGRTIIEKFETYSDVAFAVVLLTPDDVGSARAHHDELRPRARQNVIFELGFFVGRLGRQRVCALHTGDVDLPSDIDGVVYVDMDAAGGWRVLLAKELREAGVEVDLNRAV